MKMAGFRVPLKSGREVWPSGALGLKSCPYMSCARQLGYQLVHLTHPAKGSEGKCLNRVKLLETLGTTTDCYLRAMACGLIHKGGTRMAGLCWRGWWAKHCMPGGAAAGSASEPVLLLL